MSNFNKWNRDENFDSDKLNVVLFVSRNKDNKHLENFSERRNAFTTTRDFEDVKHQFKAFVEQGQVGEFSRMYVSVNPRSNSKTFKALQHKMLDNEFNLSSLPQRVAALAARKENAYDDKQKWLFDFDPVEGQDTEKLVYKFVEDLLLAHENTQTKKDQKRPQMSVKVHQLSTNLVKTYDIIVIEDLKSKNMMKNHKLAKAIGNASWYEFRTMLEYKCQWYGKQLIIVSANYTTQECSNCHHNSDKKTLDIREWTCVNCGIHHDRDINAAKNILTKGLKTIQTM